MHEPDSFAAFSCSSDCISFLAWAERFHLYGAAAWVPHSMTWHRSRLPVSHALKSQWYLAVIVYAVCTYRSTLNVGTVSAVRSSRRTYFPTSLQDFEQSQPSPVTQANSKGVGSPQCDRKSNF